MPSDPPPRRRRWSLHPDIQATLDARPEDYSPITSRSRFASFRYALAGWLYMLRYSKNLRIQAVATLLVAAVGLWLGLTPLAWAVLVVTITINWLAEFINTALEAVVNLASPDIHPMARVCKDIGASAALITAVASVIVGFLVLGPPFFERTGAWFIHVFDPNLLK